MRERPKNLSIFFSAGAQAAPAAVWKPAADVYRTRDGWLLKFELAGVRPEDAEVVASGRSITIRGVRRDWMVEDGCSYYSMEISYTRFDRTIHLPCDVEGARLGIDYRNGILLVRVFMEGEAQ